ncbi:MAG: PAS domain-containing protein [Kouleothrix sp.]
MPKSEIGNIPDEWFKRVHPDDRERLEVHLAAHFRRLIAQFEHEYRVLHRDGNYRWMLCRGLQRSGMRPGRPCAWPGRRPTSPIESRPSSACSTMPCTTCLPACPTARCWSTGWGARWRGSSARPTTALPCCFSTSTASR